MKPQPYFGADLISEIAAVIRSGPYSNFGPQSQKLEASLAASLKVDAQRVVSVANATLGLSGAMFVANMDEWRIPSWTFAASPC